nr:MAG TPA: hypothetical protein [Bacteriophage sp.]DAO71005.1 MAG TPA: hypothetical protein [Caudoviricetes sp.]
MFSLWDSRHLVQLRVIRLLLVTMMIKLLNTF